MKKLKYRLIKAIATLLRCDDIIDYDVYEDVIPRVIKPFKGNIPDSLIRHEAILYNNMNRNRLSYYETLKQMGLGQPSNQPLEHYEALTKKGDKFVASPDNDKIK